MIYGSGAVLLLAAVVLLVASGCVRSSHAFNWLATAAVLSAFLGGVLLLLGDAP